MKTSIFKQVALSIFLIGAFNSCEKDNTITENENIEKINITGNNKCIKGSGTIKTQRRNVASFTKLNLKASANIYLTTGNTKSVVIKGDNNIISFIETNVSSGTLTIDQGNKCFTNATINIYISTPNVRSLKINGVGNIVGKNKIKNPNLDLIINGSGTIEASVETKSLKANGQGASVFKLSGNAKTQNLIFGGSSSYKGYGLISEDTNIKATGFNSAQVYASNKLTGSISQFSTVFYKGSPKTVDVSGGIVIKK